MTIPCATVGEATTEERGGAPGDRRGGNAAIGASALDQARLVQALARSLRTSGPGTGVRILETHISYVLLTGAHAYKIKKAVDFGFLDFTTLAARRRFCEEELRLNGRLAPELYLDVVSITGTVDAAVIGGAGPAIEYAVRMREFAQEALASRLLERGELGAADIDALAARVAGFHGTIDVAPTDGAFGAPDEILRFAQESFAQLRPLLATDAERAELEELRAWTEGQHAARRSAFAHRRGQGFVRECHGDLHLANIARIDGELVIFDGIEFNAAMRFVDVMSEVAFTVMDLQARGRADLAHRFLNAYLERTGDYAGLAVLPFYLAYRALVRAKIARLRASQLGAGAARDAAEAESRRYLSQARSYAKLPRPALIITHGLSGSGKSAVSQALLEAIGAVRVRSDVERKRLHGIATLERSDAGIERGPYVSTATAATYERMRILAVEIIAAGCTAIVDATFLRHSQRGPFRALAMGLGVAFVILSLEASEATLRQRVVRRRAEGGDPSDADLAVLLHQMATREPLTAYERAHAVAYDAEAPLEAASADAWMAIADRLGRARPFPRATVDDDGIAALLMPVNAPVEPAR